MATIETIYRCRIDYTWEGTRRTGYEAVENRAFELSYKEPKVEIESGVSAACPPYIILESESRAAVERLAGKIERYINRRKDVVLEN